MKIKWKRMFMDLLPGILAVLVILPVFMALSASIKSSSELNQMLSPVFMGGKDYLKWRFFPGEPTGMHFVNLLLFTPQFLTVFWNSVKIVCLILAGQLLIGVPAAWAFAAYQFKGQKTLFSMYIVLMLMPFQVTMLSRYLVLNQFGMMDTHAAVILPEVFSTFPVFLIYRGFRTIPKGIFEAAKIDGAGSLAVFFQIGIPMGSSGILSAIVLGFLEYWNLMEQPLAYLKTKSLWPLSLYLPEVGMAQAGQAFAAAAVMLLPAAFVFYAGQDYLEQGIAAAALKE